MKSPFAKNSLNSATRITTDRSRETQCRKLRLAVARGLMLAGAATLGTVAGTGMGTSDQVVMAADCDCWDGSCDACGSMHQTEPDNVLYKSLDAVAGGIEKVLGLDKKSGSICDDLGCDGILGAASMQELMLPMAPVQIQHPNATHTHPPVAVPSSPSASASTSPYVPSPHYAPAPPSSVPKVVEESAVIPHVESEAMPTVPQMRNTIPQPIPEAKPAPVPQPIPEAAPQKEGSLFDALDDPFSDDEVRNYRPYRNVRPSGFLQKAPHVPASTKSRTTIRPNSGTPARKATHRLPVPTLNAPVRQTSVMDHQAIGSGIARASATEPSPREAVAKAMGDVIKNKEDHQSSSAIVDLTPTNYLSSSRSASRNR